MAKRAKAEVPVVDPRERHAANKIEAINKKLDPLIQGVQPIHTFVVRNAMDAALAAEVINQDIPPYRNLIKEMWGEDKRKAYDLYKSISDKFTRFDKPAENLDRSLRQAIAKWSMEEQRKRDAEAAKQQAKIEKKNPGAAVVVQSERVEVGGTTFAKRRMCEVRDPDKLLKLIVEGKAPRNFIQWNDTEILREARRLYDATQPDKNGKRFIYDGTVEVFEEPEIRKAR